MNSLRPILLAGISTLFLINAVIAQSPRARSGLKYRAPRTLSELESQSSPPQDDVVTAEYRQLSDYILNDSSIELQDDRRRAKLASFLQEEDTRDAKDDEDEEDDETAEDSKDPRRFAPLRSMLDVAIAAPVSPGILPEDYAESLFDSESTEYQLAGFQRGGNYGGFSCWCAPWVAYRPLYFEDVWLERHGYDYGCLQPVVSAAKFYGRIPLFPYMLGANPCRQCTYSLGLGRVGDCPPHFFTLPKKSCRGILYQTAAVTGLVLLTP